MNIATSRKRNWQNITKQYLSQLETGQRTGSIKIMKAIAKALSVDLDDLVL